MTTQSAREKLATRAALAACERERDDARVELAAIRAAYDKATGGKTSLVEAFDNLNATIAALRSAVATAREALETCEEVICFQRDKVGCPGEGDGVDRHTSEENWPGSWLAIDRAHSALAALNAVTPSKGE